ncbi:hypothetical protein HYP06_gp026 [Vibrio phage vB_VspP_pVa5]|uniref:Uncharacterized protein n=1 Tax=Vibrio phage vB_VspP_pVa5 TaxID=1913109 RepID=A0A1J0GV56_9CAUD|nr:hypothetical protein HYP06_gp026 [Vibrio phage vB_VspP_pVa5]APC46066.1 hypothetical protein vBVspPpVa5_0026 [Vibrio phage vB_VspP_pVa5]
MLEIIKSLKIKVTQADVEQALIELIAKQDPTIIVDSIEFSAKRSGKDSIAVAVEAHFGENREETGSSAACGTGSPSEETTENVAGLQSEASDEVIPEVTDEEDEAPFETEAEPTAKQSLFG